VQQLIDSWLTLPLTRLLGILNQQRGQTLAEYGLIVTVIAVAIVVTSIMLFRNTLAAAFTTSSGCLDGGC
jgi:Flp pilus assembly pilin Flp